MGLYNSLAIPRLPLSIPWSAKGEKSSLSLVLLAVAPVVLPVAYTAYVVRQSAQRTTASARITPPEPLVGLTVQQIKAGENETAAGDTLAIPPAILAAASEYVIARERVVSEAVLLEKILPGLRGGLSGSGAEDDGGRGLLETYLATTMRMFTWTPQAFAMKAMVSRLPNGAGSASTFSRPYLDACSFEVGDRVCGVYVVRRHIVSSRNKGERIFLDLSPPEGWKGPVVSGVLDCGFVVEEKGGVKFVRFVNETILWRRKDGGKPTLLEGAVSRWLHAAMIKWMMVRGIEAVTGVDGGMKAKTV
ncbi:hypothetical protein GGR51DRAFT_535854 [Nemania sp. FL0031]|nr:hypothetical protein GGR51DRAFT_535854 [Nemania sp. FL0031]